MKKIKINVAIIIASLSIASCSTTVIEPVEAQAGDVTFSANIRSVAAANCTLTCHNPRSLDAGLNLSTDELFIEQAKENNLIIDRIIDGTMPPTGKLSDENIALFTEWRTGGFLK